MQDEAWKTLQISPSSSSEGISIKKCLGTPPSIHFFSTSVHALFENVQMYSVKDNGTVFFKKSFKMLYVVAIYLDAE